MAQQAPRTRRDTYIMLLNWAIVSVGIALVVLIGLLVAEQLSDDEPMRGPGTFPGAQDAFEFRVMDGWEVVHDGAQTLVKHDELPTYRVAAQPIEQSFAQNWNCEVLQDHIAEVTLALVSWEAVELVTVDIPCADNPAAPGYAQVYLTLTDSSGRGALLVFGRLDGLHWITARTDLLNGPAPEGLAEAMRHSVIGASPLE
jgi:hypothetical protein